MSDDVRKLRILVVDRDPAGRDCLLILLKFWGHEARGVGDGLASLQAVAEFQPDVVFLDLDAPGLPADEVILKIRQDLNSRAFLVALSGWGQPAEVHKAMAAGCDQYLFKPCDPAQLKTLLDGLSPASDSTGE